MKFKHPIAFAMAAASLLAAPLLHAQEAAYPRQAVTLVVPFRRGVRPTPWRLLAQKLGDRLGQQVIIDNRGGAGGGIAAELVARAPADGHTLFSGTTGTLAINPSLYARLRYDPVKDFAPVSLMATTMNVLVASPGIPAKNLADLIALAKTRPGELTYGSAGNGSSITCRANCSAARPASRSRTSPTRVRRRPWWTCWAAACR